MKTILYHITTNLSVVDIITTINTGRLTYNMREYCTCAGDFCNTSSSDKLIEQLIMFDSIAK